MTLLDDILKGLEYNGPYRPGWGGAPVDFVATGPAAAVVALAGWWKEDWATLTKTQEAVLTFDRPLVPWGGGWQPDGYDGHAIEASGSGEMDRKISRNRDAADFDRQAYLSALSDMRDGWGTRVNLDEWTDYFLSRPIRHPLSELRRELTKPREMGKAFILSPEGEILDVMVIDASTAVTAANHPYLSSVATDYNNKASKPPLADYLDWLAGQQPYGAESIDSVSIFTADGFLEDRAAKILADRRGGV